SYTVKYHYNYPVGGNGVSDTVSTSATIVLESPPTYPEGYTFLGWSRSGSGSAPYYAEGSTYTLTYSTTHFYGVWGINTQTVTFTAGANGSLSGSTSSIVNYNTPWSSVSVPTPNGNTGYAFKEWSPSLPAGSDKITTDLSFTASFEPISYNINYNLDGGTNNGSNPSTYTVESSVMLSDPTKVGYRFIEWQENGVSTTGIPAGSTGAKTFTAIWGIDEYILSYNLNGAAGTPPASTTFANGTTVSGLAGLPAGIVYLGYTFDGWSLTPGGSKVTSVTIQDSDIELYARWNAETYTLFYNRNGGIGAVPAAVGGYTIGQTVTSFAAKPYSLFKQGYTFLGWGTSANSGVVESVTFGTSNITLYAQWQINTYTVKFFGMYGELLKTETVNFGGSATPPDTDIYNGFQFEMWSSSRLIMWPASYTNINANTNVYGWWLPIPYSITYGGVEGAFNPNIRFAYTVVSPTITLRDPIKEGYVFTGWEPEGIIPHGSTGNKHFVANWEADTDNDGVADKDEFRVTYDLNSGSGTTPVDTYIYSGISSQSTFTAASQGDINRFGYTFLGWDKDGNAATANISAGSSGNPINSTTGNITLYAIWQVNQYNITYILGDGGVNGLNPAAYNVNTLPLTFNAPSRDGYVFVEWQDESAVAAAGISSGSTGDRTFTAVWEEDTDRDGVADKDEFRVTYDLNSGSGTTPVDTYLYSGISPQSTFTAASQGDINRFGYTFLGWDKDGSAATASIAAGTEGNAINATTGNVTLYAIWQLNQYTITYAGLAGSSFATTNPNVTTFSVETPTFTITNPTRPGYTFNGWTGTGLSTNTNSITIESGSTGDRTYTATWTINFIPATVTPTPIVTPVPPVVPAPVVTPAPTTTPAPTASPTPELTTIPEESTPLNPSPDAGLTEIPDEEVPLAAQPETADVLTLVNLIAMVLTLVGAVLMLLKKSKKDEETGKEESGFKRTGTKVISLIAAAGGVAFFFLTQPLKGLDIWDKYSIWQLLIFAVGAVMAIAAHTKKKAQENVDA
ncbi:MAG TPA: InlB B-repeat-containing protein, partial [Clostridia bacterium]|nr:InlB B-repeat-containing protein [Clostridia bacterium]